MKYISIDSVLFDISLSIDEQYWDENAMKEWAIKGFRKMQLPLKFVQKVAVVPITSHKGTLPECAAHITHAACKTNLASTDLAELERIIGSDNSERLSSELAQRASESIYNLYRNSWKAIRPSTNSFLKTVYCESIIPASLNPTENDQYKFTSDCELEYHVDPNGVITTSFKTGLLFVSYLAHTTDTDGDILIPDDETLKEAIMHYCMYRYWLSKSFMHEEASTRERDWHLQRYQILKLSAIGNLNLPSVGQLENIKNMTNRILPDTNQYNRFFYELGRPENTTF